ncbi:MAG: GNAT family N-acetyltransferase [Nitrospirae bacterium]|nr:GNAT family N-acetyltransferase [Nitrospirota bacterium]
MKTSLITKELLTDNNLLLITCERLAMLHAAGTPNDLMTQIGTGFLKNIFYPGLIASPNAVISAVVDDNESIVAFAAVALNMKRCLRDIVSFQPLRSIWYGFSRVLSNNKLWRPFIESMLLRAPEQSKRTAEILMITTAHSYRGRRFGIKLLSTIDDCLKGHSIRTCIARVREDNNYATRMYESNGYCEVDSITFNGCRWRWLSHKVA